MPASRRPRSKPPHPANRLPSGTVMPKGDAVAFAEKLRTQWREEAKGGSAPDPRRTVGMLAERYAREHVRRPGRRPDPIAAAENYLRIIRRLKIRGRKFEDLVLESVTADDLEALREARRAELREAKRLHAEGKTKGRVVLPQERGGEIGIEHLMATLRHMFSWAAKKNLVAATPFKRNGETAVTVRAECIRAASAASSATRSSGCSRRRSRTCATLSWHSWTPAAESANCSRSTGRT